MSTYRISLIGARALSLGKYPGNAGGDEALGIAPVPPSVIGIDSRGTGFK
jgi:hypothetical protein